ncbi:MAG TPA: glutamate racemase [bacterium]|nr:glutamate racemase [bacterium]
MSDQRPIGVFDSGVGGLTVVRELFKTLPNENIIYFGDTARVPYGTKSPQAVERFALQDIFFLLNRNVKLLVAACHTVSSVVLDKLVSQLHLPILGVVEPGVDAALKATRARRIGVIGTRATIASGCYAQKIIEKNNEVSVISQACPLFVPLAEEGWINEDVTRKTAEIYLAPLIDKQVDTLILACTHYPLLKPVIQDVMGAEVVIIDSAEETARRIARRLQVLNMKTDVSENAKHEFFVSDIPSQFQCVGERFLGCPLDSLIQVDLEDLDFRSTVCSDGPCPA